MNSGQSLIQSLLRGRLIESQVKNPGYSLRAFSRRIGLTPSATSEIIKGKRRVSRVLVERIAQKLLMDPIERAELLKNFKNETAPDLDRSALRLTADQFEAISDGVHFAILSLVRTAGFKSDSDFMSKRLGRTKVEIERALKRLVRLGLLKRDKNQNYCRLENSIRTSDDIWNLSLQKAHVQDMEIAKKALSELPIELRDFTALTLPASPSKLPEAKRLIREFQSQMSALLESGPGTEVYQMSVYLFPLTRVKNLQNNPKNRRK